MCKVYPMSDIWSRSASIVRVGTCLVLCASGAEELLANPAGMCLQSQL